MTDEECELRLAYAPRPCDVQLTVECSACGKRFYPGVRYWPAYDHCPMCGRRNVGDMMLGIKGCV